MKTDTLFDFAAGANLFTVNDQWIAGSRFTRLVFLPWDGRQFGEPEWQRVTKAEVEMMIGEKLP